MKKGLVPANQLRIGSAQRPIEKQMIMHLADLIDPMPSVIVEQGQEDVWIEPPDIIEWGESRFVDPITGKLIKLVEIQKRILRKIFSMIWEKKVVTVLYSTLKKSGKTAIAGLVGSYWGEHVEPPNEIITIANDKEQAAGRIYAALVPTMRSLGWNVPDKAPLMTNPSTGTVIKAIGTNYEGEAGGNYGLTLWSELWAYQSERRKRLWDEMTPVPTRKYSVRWVETYAGFKGESELLWSLYTQAFKDGDEEQQLGQRIEGLEDLPCWYIPSSKMFVYWDHEPRLPWQTPEYYEQQRSELRPSTFRRFHKNDWVASEERFIDPIQWDVLEGTEPLNEEGDVRSIIVAADASKNNDNSSLVASSWNDDPNWLAPDIVGCWTWEPKEDSGLEGAKIVDLSLVEKKLRWLLDNFDVVCVTYDPHELHSIMTNLRKEYDANGTRKLFVEFNQGNDRLKSDKAFYDWIAQKKLRRIRDSKLREHVLNAVADDDGRIEKEKTTAKVDAAVAASMSCYMASLRFRPKRRFLKV